MTTSLMTNPPADICTTYFADFCRTVEQIGSLTFNVTYDPARNYGEWDVRGNPHTMSPPTLILSRAYDEFDRAVATFAQSVTAKTWPFDGLPTLLQRFDQPVSVTIWTGEGSAEFIVGGYCRHDKDYNALPLEVELSAKFENC